MVIIIRCNDIDPDPRVQKYLDFLTNKNIKYKIIAWDRKGRKLKDTDNIVYFKKKCEFGAGIKNLYLKVQWMFFIAWKLLVHRDEYQLIHACDFDAAFPAIIMKGFGKKIIFDVFDWLGGNNTAFIYKIMAFFERYAAQKSDYLIVCEEYRKDQIDIQNKRILVMPNIPEVDISPFTRNNVMDNLIISYVGTFDNHRGIEDLLKIVSQNDKFILKIAGFGKLEQLVKEYSKCYTNIQYYGMVKHEDGLRIMNDSDIIAAFYYTKDCDVHLYAAPNKYYEATMLGKPIISNQGTFMAERIAYNNIGLITNESELDIMNMLVYCLENKNKLDDIGKISRRLWETEYKEKIARFLNGNYLPIILNKSNT